MPPEALLRALRVEDDQSTLKIRALPDGSLLLEVQLDDPSVIAVGYWLLRVDATQEASVREFLNERHDARQE